MAAELAGPLYARTGLGGLRPHLERAYQIRVTGLAELDLGVYRVDRAGGGSWVARVFPAVRPAAAADGDAEVLRFAQARDFPAERLAHPEPVSVLDGQAVLVTEHVAGVRGEQRRQLLSALGGQRRLGQLLGDLHGLPAGDVAGGRPGGAWHHLADGGPAAEIAAARRQLDEALDRAPAGAAGDALRAELASLADAGLDDGAALPQALLHPDFVLANVVASPDRGMVLVDWAGAGRGPRLWSLGFLLWAAGAASPGRVDRAVAGYRSRLRPEPEELTRLAAAVRARPVIFASWRFSVGRQDAAAAAAAAAQARELAYAIAARARTAFAA